MINIHSAVYALDLSIVSIRGDVAYDANENVIEYNKEAAQTKLVELQAAETQKQQQEQAAKESAVTKLTALGLTADEVKALLGL